MQLSLKFSEEYFAGVVERLPLHPNIKRNQLMMTTIREVLAKCMVLRL